MTEELVKLIKDASGFDPDRDRLLPTCLQLGIDAYVQVADGLMVVSRGIAVDPAKGFGPEVGGMPVLVGHPECRYIRLEHSQLVRLEKYGVIKCSDFRSELLLETSKGLVRRQPLMSYLVCNPGLQAFAAPATTPSSSDSSELDPLDQMNFQRSGVWEGIVELSRPQEVTLYIRDLHLFPGDSERVREQVATSAGIEDPWGHRRKAPAVSLVYRAAKHFSQTEYSFSAADRWIREHDIYGVFEGKSKAREYAARLINRNPKIGSIESEDFLEVEKIHNNQLRRDYSDPVCSKRLSLLLLATDMSLDSSMRQAPKSALEAFLRELGFSAGDKDALKEKRAWAGRPKNSPSAIDKENPCAYLASAITAEPQHLGVVAEPQKSPH